MTPETPETPVSDSGKSRNSYSGNSGKSLDTGIPEFPEKPESKIVRIILSRVASDALTAAGDQCFAVIGRASYPDDPARWVIHIAPVSFGTAHDACEVLMGTKRAAPIRKSKTDDIAGQ